MFFIDKNIFHFSIRELCFIIKLSTFMELQDYWNILSQDEAYEGTCRFYENGFLALTAKDHFYFNVYNASGHSFHYTCPENWYVFRNGMIALKAVVGWHIIKPDMRLYFKIEENDVTFLEHHSFIKKDADGNSVLYFLETPQKGIMLGKNVIETRDSPEYLYAVKKKHGRVLKWFLYDELQQDLTARSHPQDIFFLASGSYALRFNNIIRLFNKSHRKIFALDKKSTTFHLAGKGFFSLYDRMYSFTGLYSDEDGQCIKKSPVDIYWPNGAFYDQFSGLTLANGEKICGFKFGDCGRINNELGYICYNGMYFVVNTSDCKADLREKVKDAIVKIAKQDFKTSCVFDYFATLNQLLL